MHNNVGDGVEDLGLGHALPLADDRLDGASHIVVAFRLAARFASLFKFSIYRGLSLSLGGDNAGILSV